MRLLRFTLSLHEPFQVFLLCRPAVHILYTVGYQDKGRPLICNVPANWLQHFKGVLTLAPKLLWRTKLEQTVCCELVFVISKDGAEMFKGSAVLRHGVHSQSLFCSLIQVVLLPGRCQNVTHPGYFSNLVKEHTTALVHSLSTVTRTDWEKKLRVWVRNAVKIVAVLSASSHEKESCCLEAWVSVRSVWRICFVMPRETCYSPELNPTGWSPVMQLQDVFFMLIEILRPQHFQTMVKVEARRLFWGSGLSRSDTPNTLLLRCLRLASDNHPGLA